MVSAPILAIRLVCTRVRQRIGGKEGERRHARLLGQDQAFRLQIEYPLCAIESLKRTVCNRPKAEVHIIARTASDRPMRFYWQ